MLAIILIILGLSFLILIHEAGHFIAAKQAGIKVEEFGFGFPPRIFAWRRGETEYSFNWLPFGGFVRIYGENKHRLEETIKETGGAIDEKRTFYNQSFRNRFMVIAAGIAINFIAGWLLLSAVFMIGARQTVVVTDIQAGSPAELIGLQSGDLFSDFEDAEEFVAYTRSNQGKKIVLGIEREGELQNLEVTLRKVSGEADGPLGAAVASAGFARESFFAALRDALVNSLVMVAEIFRAFGRLLADLVGHASVPENIMGPVGIFGIAGDLGRLGAIYVLQLIAMISLNLAALNAIPFPALDGGRILFMLIEKIKGSPLNPKRELWANVASFGFLLLLMLIITGRDIVRLF